MNNEETKPRQQSGLFIVLEGCDGCGKKAIISDLETQYKDDDRFVFIKDPIGTDLGKSILKNLKNKDISAETRVYLYTAARNDAIEKIIVPALKAGKIVISDRFALSTWAYQNAEDNTLTAAIKDIMKTVADKVSVDHTIYVNGLVSELEKKCADNDEILRIKNLVLWYNMALLGAEFPSNLIGKVQRVELDSSLKENVKSCINNIVKDFLNKPSTKTNHEQQRTLDTESS